MNTGERLQNARKVRGLTQMELGLEMHYNYRSASVRIAQYENGLKNPSSETIDALASALGISRKALTGPEGYEVEDVIRFLFELEDQGYSVEIRRRGKELVAEISGERLSRPLEQWRKIQSRYRNDALTQNQYLTWKLCWTIESDDSKLA